MTMLYQLGDFDYCTWEIEVLKGRLLCFRLGGNTTKAGGMWLRATSTPPSSTTSASPSPSLLSSSSIPPPRSSCGHMILPSSSFLSRQSFSSPFGRALLWVSWRFVPNIWEDRMQAKVKFQASGMIQPIHSDDGSYITSPGTISAGYQNFLICIEMLFAAVAMKWVCCMRL